MMEGILTAWARPASTANQTQDVSLWRAYRVHCVAAALSIVLIVLATACWNVRGPIGPASIGAELIDIAAQVVLAVQYDFVGATLRILGIAILVEAGFVLLALLITPWGAHDEPIRSSYAHALRRVWLHTTHVIPIVLLIGAAVVIRDRAERNWWRAHPIPNQSWTYPLEPESAPSDPSYKKAWQDYETALKQERRHYYASRKLRQEWARSYARSEPWFMKHAAPLIAMECVALGIWALWALLRSAGAHRSTPTIPRPPACESCGYNLTGIPVDRRCPECGEAVARSLGPDARAGTIWQRRHEVGRRAAWRQCCLNVVSHSKQFGRQLKLVSPGDDHRKFLALHLPAVFFLSAAGCSGFLSLVAVTTGAVLLTRCPEYIFSAAPIAGCLSAIGVVVLANAAALLAGVWYRVRGKRNLMAGSIQVACYLGGYLTLYATILPLSAMVVCTLKDYGLYRSPAQFLRTDAMTLAWLSWLIPNVFFLLAYFVLVVRGTAGTRYANH